MTSDLYIDVSLPYQDAKVAAVLCVGGPIKYELRVGSGLHDDWILQNVVPRTSQLYPRNVALVLGKAFL